MPEVAGGESLPPQEETRYAAIEELGFVRNRRGVGAAQRAKWRHWFDRP